MVGFPILYIGSNYVLLCKNNLVYAQLVAKKNPLIQFELWIYDE